MFIVKQKTFTITNDNGQRETITAEYLGRGQFATCYTFNGYVYSFVKYNDNDSYDRRDYSKEGIAMWADSGNVHIPDFKRVDSDDDNIAIFKSTLYNKLTKKDYPIAYRQAEILKNAWNKISNVRNSDGYTNNNEIIESVKELLPDELINALCSINGAMVNYSYNYYFEFPIRNLKVDNDGNLILLDVIFNAHALRWYKNS